MVWCHYISYYIRIGRRRHGVERHFDNLNAIQLFICTRVQRSFSLRLAICYKYWQKKTPTKPVVIQDDPRLVCMSKMTGVQHNLDRDHHNDSNINRCLKRDLHAAVLR